MQTRDMFRHQRIRRLTAQRPENGTDAGVALWSRLAAQLVLIIGAGGFDSLFARSVYLSQTNYPWLAARSGHAQTDHRFDDLGTSLQAQPLPLAEEANCLLLITFTNILAALIGESLTTQILDSAWGIDEQNNDPQDKAAKETKNV